MVGVGSGVDGAAGEVGAGGGLLSWSQVILIQTPALP